MKKVWTKLSSCFLAICALVLAIGLTSCTPRTSESVVLVITVTEAEEGATLKDVMTQMKEDGELTFTDVGGMITEINGSVPDSDAHEFLALYTSLDGYTFAAYGTIVVDGVTYESSIVGYEALPAVVGETYIWGVSTW